MQLLAPLALLWAVSIPVLIWLWRFAATQHRTVVPSLAPFAHLLRRPPTRRSRLILNVLFWLQLATVSLLTLTLTEPVRLGHSSRTTLVLLDTSASMRASIGAPSAFTQAKQQLLSWLSRRGPGERVFVVQTSPPAPLVEDLTTDLAQVGAAVRAVEPSDLGGNLAVARRIGQALLGQPPDETLVFTDEPAAEEPKVTFRSFNEPLPNVAIVGVDAYEPLCIPTPAQLVVTIQNFAKSEQPVQVSVMHDGRRLAQQEATLGPEGRTPVSFTLPEQAAGIFEVRLSAKHDALALDNQAWALLRGAQRLPVAVASSRPAFVDAVGRWLEACPRVEWTSSSGASSSGSTLVTDDEALASTWPSSAMLFARSSREAPGIVAQSVTVIPHPIAEYLDPLEAIPGVVPSAAVGGAWGDPVIWGVANGQKLPLVRAASVGGRRLVGILADPAASGAGASSVASALMFFNSLRWLSGTFGGSMVGEPLVVGPFEPGTVLIQLPQGDLQRRAHDGGWLTYDATDHAGLYRFTQGRLAIERVVNALDPAESNTLSRSSTWAAETSAGGSAPPPGRVLHRARHSLASEDGSGSVAPPRQSLAPWLLLVLVLLIAAEWILYSRWKT